MTLLNVPKLAMGRFQMPAPFLAKAPAAEAEVLPNPVPLYGRAYNAMEGAASRAHDKSTNALKTAMSTLSSLRREPVVQRDSEGAIIGPAHQFVLAAVNHNKTPFTIKTACAVMGGLLLIGMATKSGMFNSPVALVSAADSVGDAAVGCSTAAVEMVADCVTNGGVCAFDPQDKCRTDYFDGFTASIYKCNTAKKADIPGVTCYAPGGSYYERATKDPAYAKLWGYGNLTQEQKDQFMFLMMFGGMAGFIYGNRKQFQAFTAGLMGTTDPLLPTSLSLTNKHLVSTAVTAAKCAAIFGGSYAFLAGLDRTAAHPLATWGSIITGTGVLIHEYRPMIQRISGAKEMPWPKSILAGIAYVMGEGVYRFAADSAGMHQFTPQGHETIYGNWAEWEPKFNLLLFAAEISALNLLSAPIWSRAGGIIQNTIDVSYTGISAWSHSHAEQNIIAAKLSKAMQKVHAAKEGEPAYLNIRKSVQAFTQAEKEAVQKGLMPGGLTVTELRNRIFPSDDRKKALLRATGLVASGALSYAGAVSLTTMLGGNLDSLALDVPLAVAGAAAAATTLRSAMRLEVGSAMFGQMAALATVGGLSYAAGNSAWSLIQVESHKMVADILVSAAGLAAAGGTADAALRDGVGRLRYNQYASLMGHLFGPQGRAMFWVIYTAVAGSASVGISSATQAMAGFEAKAGYYFELIKRALLNPWINRIAFGLRTAIWPDKPISKFGFFLPGYFSVYAGLEYGAQTGQSVDLMYQAAASEFSVTSDPEAQAALLAEMREMETLVDSAVANEGYGRSVTMDRASASQGAIGKYQEVYNIPEAQ